MTRPSHLFLPVIPAEFRHCIPLSLSGPLPSAMAVRTDPLPFHPPSAIPLPNADCPTLPPSSSLFTATPPSESQPVYISCELAHAASAPPPSAPVAYTPTSTSSPAAVLSAMGEGSLPPPAGSLGPPMPHRRCVARAPAHPSPLPSPLPSSLPNVHPYVCDLFRSAEPILPVRTPLLYPLWPCSSSFLSHPSFCPHATPPLEGPHDPRAGVRFSPSPPPPPLM